MIGFYAVKWGDTIRITVRSSNPGEACRNAFGMISHDMQTCYITNNKAKLQTIKFRKERLDNPKNWIPVPTEYLDRLDRLLRQSEES